MDTDERIALLEKRLEAYDKLVAKLLVFAKTTKSGRMLLRVIGAEE